MNMKKLVSAMLFAWVSFAAVTVSAQKAPSDFAFTFEGAAVTAGFRVPVEARVVKSAPYSAEIVNENIQTLADGNRIVQRSNTRIYRDSEGRVRREEDRPAGSPAISITDPVGRVSFTLDPENRVAWQTRNTAFVRITEELEKLRKSHALADAADRLKAVAASRLGIPHRIEEEKIGRGRIEAGLAEQVKVERLPARDIEGVRAEGTRRTTTIAAGAIGNELPIEIVSEEWTSPDLKILVLTEHRDPRLGTSTYRVVNIVRAEPDRYLFEVPSDYTLKETGMVHKGR